jgi:type I restriction enzyme, S subunit
MATNQGFKSFVPSPQQIDAKFLYHWLRTNRVYLESLGNGATFKEVSKTVVERIEIPLPPLLEQRRIATILDLADALRAKRRVTLSGVDALLAATFLDVFETPGAHSWPEVTIESLTAAIPNSIRTGPFGSQLLHSEFVESGIAVLGIDNVVQNDFLWARPRFITERKYQELKRYTVRPGDVLITIMGTCGRCAIVPRDVPVAINTKHLCCITLDQSRCLPIYLKSCFLLHPKVQLRLGVHERGAVMPGLNMQIIKELRIPLAPMQVQRQFAERVKSIERLRAAQRVSEAELNSLFASVQHRAFRGEF